MKVGTEQTEQTTTISPFARRVVLLIWITGWIAFVIGVGLLWTCIDREHRRHELWRVPMFWLSEAVAIYYFTGFGVRRGILGIPLTASSKDTKRFGRKHFTLVGWLIAGWVGDLAIAVHETQTEDAAFKRSVSVTGMVTAYSMRINVDVVWAKGVYDLECEYADKAGTKYCGSFVVGNFDIPRATIQGFARGQQLVPIPIRYDPEYPLRSWAGGQEVTHGQHLIGVYCLGLPLQFAVIIWISLTDGFIRTRDGILPLGEIVPMYMSAAVVVVFGCLRWSTGFAY